MIRAIEPVDGLDLMYRDRPNATRDRDLGSGPGKLTQALDIGPEFHGSDLTRPPLYFLPPDRPVSEIEITTRIGLTRGIELDYRYLEAGNPHVSPGVPSDIAAVRRRKKKGVPR